MTRIAVLPALEDNYAYIVCAGDGGATLVDAPASAPILEYLRQHQLRLTQILITHTHWDHVAGLADVEAETGARLYQPDATLAEGLEIAFGSGTFKVIATPGHGDRDVSFLWQAPGEPPALFCGDTLFGSGCGRILQGRSEQLWQSLQRIWRLPDETLIYCGHEYTLDNLEFACFMFPHDPAYSARRAEINALRNAGKPSVPSTLAVEKIANPFLRCVDLNEFTALRKAKDRF